MATPDHLLKDWDGFVPGAVLTSFSKPQEWVYSDNNSHTYSVQIGESRNLSLMKSTAFIVNFVGFIARIPLLSLRIKSFRM